MFTRKSIWPALAIALAAASVAPAWGQTGGTGDVDRLFAEAEAFWIRRDEQASARSAVAVYERLAAIAPDRSEFQVRLARALWWYGVSRPGAPAAERVGLFRRTITAAREAQRLAPRDPGGFYWEAVGRAHAAIADGGFVSLAELWRMRAAGRRARALSPWYLHGSIRYAEAELILALPAVQRWLVARSARSAVDLTLEALSFENKCFYGHWVLARALDASNRRSAARAQLDWILATRPEVFLPDAPENRVVQRWAAALRAALSPGAPPR
jgi:hypothetical protein